MERDKEEKKKTEQTAVASDIVNSGLSDIPFHITGNAIRSSENQKNVLTDSVADDNGVLDEITESLSSVKDTILDSSGEILENTVKIIGDVAGGITEAIGDAVSNIDL